MIFGPTRKAAMECTLEVFKTRFFVMTLAWSRHQYVKIVRDQKVLIWLGCHRRALEFFGGAPAKVVIETSKPPLPEPAGGTPSSIVHMPLLLKAMTFSSRLARRMNLKKGIVESGVKYVKRNFLPLREFLASRMQANKPKNGIDTPLPSESMVLRNSNPLAQVYR